MVLNIYARNNIANFSLYELCDAILNMWKTMGEIFCQLTSPLFYENLNAAAVCGLITAGAVEFL